MKHHFDQTNIFIESEDKYFIEVKVTTCRFHHCEFEANQFRPLVQKKAFFAFRANKTAFSRLRSERKRRIGGRANTRCALEEGLIANFRREEGEKW